MIRPPLWKTHKDFQWGIDTLKALRAEIKAALTEEFRSHLYEQYHDVSHSLGLEPIEYQMLAAMFQREAAASALIEEPDIVGNAGIKRNATMP